MPLDQFRKVGRLSGRLDEFVLEQLLGRRAHARVALQTQIHKVAEWLGEPFGQLWRWVLRDEEQHLHRVQAGVRRLAVGQLDGCDAQTPDVGFVVIARLLDHLG